MLDKFPFEDTVIKELAFLDHAITQKYLPVVSSSLQPTQFTSLSTDEMDTLTIEFQDF